MRTEAGPEGANKHICLRRARFDARRLSTSWLSFRGVLAAGDLIDDPRDEANISLDDRANLSGHSRPILFPHTCVVHFDQIRNRCLQLLLGERLRTRERLGFGEDEIDGNGLLCF